VSGGLETGFGDDVGAPFVRMAGGRVGRSLVLRQSVGGGVGIVDDSRVADLDDVRRDHGGQIVDDGRRHPIGCHIAHGIEVRRRYEHGPAGLAVPCGSQHRVAVGPVRLDERGDRLGPDPGHPGRPEQDGRGVDDFLEREFRAADHLADRPGCGRGRGAVDGFRACQSGRDGPLGVRCEDDDRERAARPGEVGEAADTRLAEGVGDGAIGGGGQDDGCDGHVPECTRRGGPTAAVSLSVGQSDVPSDQEQYSTVPDAPILATRTDLRNVAIVAHVDHGKTTLVDAMLRQTGAFRSNQALVDRVMDSGDLEREKGITILAKQTTVDHAGVRLNIVDTPGHADFGGEVERSLLMVDSVLLLVDAAEGPLPQTRYVLQKAMARRLPVVVAINKIDRGDARPDVVLDDIYELFMDLGADSHQIEFPIVYTNAKAGTATRDLAEPGTDLGPLLDLLIEVTPPVSYTPDHPLQLLVTNLSANDYVGRMAVGRIWNGTIRTGQRIVVVREEADDPTGAIEPGRTVTLSGTVTSLQTAHGIDRVDIEEAGPGDIVSVAGLPEVTIGDTLTDPADPRPLPRLDVDAPTLRMTFGVNTSPLAGREGKYVTSRQIKARLEKEVLGNVSIEVRPSESSEAFEVRGRGELQLAVLIEQMRREGFELTASRPEVLLREVRGELQEPYERITIDIPPEYIGEIQTALAGRKGRLEQLSTDTDGRVRMEYVLPVRGLIGYRGQLLTDTRGTALLHQIGEGYGPWAGEVTHRTNGVLVADRAGVSNAYGLFNLEQRAELFIGAGVEVYEGMIVGENSRSGDMDVNATKEKKLTNIRTHSHDESLRLTPARPVTLETALEFISADELVEVTPQSIRLRKRALSQHDRRREAGRAEEVRRSSDREGATA